jgi:ribosome-associated protein
MWDESPYHSDDMNANNFDQPMDDEFDEDTRAPSKSALKRQSHELQELGKQLLAMPDSRLASIDMPERLRDALDQWKTTRSFEGKRRQLQFIGKVMRGLDAEPLREAVASFQMGHAKDALQLHQVERWRLELINDEADAMTRWMADYPESDAQQVRNLVRQARKDAAAAPEQRNGRAFRELFQLLRKVVAAAETANPGEPTGSAGDDFED